MFSARLLRIDHAWHVVVVGFLVSMLTAGLRFSAGPFMGPIMADFGVTKTQFSAVVAASLLLYGLFMPVAGRIADLFGGRLVLTAGGLLLSLSLVISGTTRSLPIFILSFAFVASMGFAATSHVALSSVISRWFVKRRGLAMTFLSSGAMSGIALMVPLSAFLITRIGWQGTMLFFAAIILVTVLFCAVLVGGQAPDQTTASGTVAVSVDLSAWRSALGTKAFWVLALTFLACGFSMNLLGTHGVPMLEDHGFDTMKAAWGVGLIGFASLFGSLAIGVASDRFGRHNLLALIYAVRGLGFLGLLYAGLEWELYTVAILAGIVWAGSSAMTSALTADLFGARSVGVLFGLMFLSHQVGAASGSLLGGWAFDTYGSYVFPFLLTSAMLLVASYFSLRFSHSPVVLAPLVAEKGD